MQGKKRWKSETFKFPREMLDDPKWNGYDMALFGLVRNLAWQTGFCFASNTTLGSKIGLSREYVKIRLKLMEEAGWIRIERQPGYPNHIYPMVIFR